MRRWALIRVCERAGSVAPSHRFPVHPSEFRRLRRRFMIAIIFLVILVVIAVVLIGMYNSLVQLRVRCDSAWSDIDVQLKRRHDLIPNLVERVKGNAAQEKGTFENIAKSRWQVMKATTPEGKAVAEN